MSEIAVELDGRLVGREHPPYVIAEIGVNHNGDPDLAIRLIDAAAAAGADAVKLQAFRADALARSDAPQAGYQAQRAGRQSQLEMLRGLELSRASMEAVAAHAATRGVTFFASPFDLASVAMLREMEIPILKVGSGDVTNVILLRAIAALGRPVILSTGMSELDEVDLAVETLRRGGAGDLVILQCTSAYPAPLADSNLHVLDTLRNRYDTVVGYSDHTVGTTAAIVAVGLGASVVEKHITLDRGLPGPDHAASLEAAELADFIARLRDAHAALGTPQKRVLDSEADVRRVARRSLVYRHDVARGSLLEAGHLDAMRPGDGVSPARLDDLVGRRLARDVTAGTLLRPEDLEAG